MPLGSVLIKFIYNKSIQTTTVDDQAALISWLNLYGDSITIVRIENHGKPICETCYPFEHVVSGHDYEFKG